MADSKSSKNNNSIFLNYESLLSNEPVTPDQVFEFLNSKDRSNSSIAYRMEAFPYYNSQRQNGLLSNLAQLGGPGLFNSRRGSAGSGLPSVFFDYNSLLTNLKIYEKEAGPGYLSEPEEHYGSITLLDKSIKVQKIITSIFEDNDQLYKVESREFEHLIAELLESKNFKVELTKATRDGGFDIIALQDLNGFKNKFLVECKRHAKNRPVGIKVIRELCYVVRDTAANKGIIFTSSYFTKDAIRERNKRPFLLDLQDGQCIIDWVNDYRSKL